MTSSCVFALVAFGNVSQDPDFLGKRGNRPECQKTQDKPFPCNFCELRFTQVGSMNRHVKLHLGHRDHACQLCKRRFTTMWNLKQHKLRVHNRTIPTLQCDSCNRKFRSNNDLTEHTRIHTNERPFNCKVTFQINFHAESHNFIRYAGANFDRDLIFGPIF